MDDSSEKLFKFNLELDQWLKKVERKANQLKDNRDPRKQFERWRSSQDGKEWKHQQYVKQRGECAICKAPNPLKGMHIDHIKPISLYPDRALDLDNLRLLCPPCNSSRGNSTDRDFGRFPTPKK